MAFFIAELDKEQIMIAGQRKAHRQIWLAIGLALPILLFFATRDLDFSGETEDVGHPDQFVSKMLQNRTLHLKLNAPLKNPSAVVYAIDSKGNPGKILGQLYGEGEYQFILPVDASGISVVDELKNEKIYTTTF
ncbi:hypothetical protein [Flagellimonas flava]|uniref:Uncharacterized protein n=1 Tax=Flagellimonas flava TaxID=570519 RepID=A0A1M5N9F3_9FLAO|nr:hypothetical protein [Allomuricauda flava]SHG85829.1 hypothetical protein SAMN04488116_2717 [Allomuricauda flava]